jgi:hypothetical protein
MIDFITKLLLLKEPLTGIFYNSIIVIVKRLIKFLVYIPYREVIDIEVIAYVFYNRVVRE